MLKSMAQRGPPEASACSTIMMYHSTYNTAITQQKRYVYGYHIPIECISTDATLA